jgi:uncharacterized protein YggE
VRFQLSDASQGHTAALGQAIDNAKAKADAMAAAAGASVGQVVTIAEATAPSPMPYPVFAGAQDAAGAPTPVNPGTIESQVSVTVTWALT